jgi:hypothetical protein
MADQRMDARRLSTWILVTAAALANLLPTAGKFVSSFPK